jgi:hypothetical protein
MMKKPEYKVLCNQHGSVINVALLILILIFLIGIGLNRISTTDTKIATNMKIDTTTFYEAESGLDAGSELIEQNIACTLGFADTTPDPAISEANIEGMFMVKTLDFWRNDEFVDPNPYAHDPFDNTVADVYYPIDADRTEDSTDTYTHLTFSGITRFARGAAIQMAAGYEGLGKGSGGGGANVIFDVFAYRHGLDKTAATHTIQWVHKLGLGGGCLYR